VKRKTIAVVAALLVAPAAHASPVAYSINFAVEFLGSERLPDPDVQIGNHYFGSFTLDDALLLHDGLNQPGVLSDFRVQFEDVVWDMNDPTLFDGFRGPNGFGPTPGFDVLGGQVVNLRGGIVRASDTEFIDFSFDPRLAEPEPSACTGSFCGNKPNAFWSISHAGAFGGTMSVVPVSEPLLPPWMLAGLFATVALFGRRRGDITH
jgi:hypothetical protein